MDRLVKNGDFRGEIWGENCLSDNFGPIDLFLEDIETNCLSGHPAPLVKQFLRYAPN